MIDHKLASMRRQDAVAALLPLGLSPNEMAERIGCSGAVVRTCMARLRGYVLPSCIARRAAARVAEFRRIVDMAATPDRIPLHNGMVALIDPADFEIVAPIRWLAHFQRDRWYVRTSHGALMHRIILGLPDGGPLVDHRNGDGLDNRRVNLRAASAQQNCWNSRGHSRGTRFKGIYWYKATQQWTGQVTTPDGRRVSIGYHDDEVAAAMARDRIAAELHGEFARLNFPRTAVAKMDLDSAAAVAA